MSKRKTVGRFELGESWPCECGARHVLTGAYLAAHWNEKLTHACEHCGAVHSLVGGHVTLVKKGRAREESATA